MHFFYLQGCQSSIKIHMHVYIFRVVAQLCVNAQPDTHTQLHSNTIPSLRCSSRVQSPFARTKSQTQTKMATLLYGRAKGYVGVSFAKQWFKMHIYFTLVLWISRHFSPTANNDIFHSGHILRNRTDSQRSARPARIWGNLGTPRAHTASITGVKCQC